MKKLYRGLLLILMMFGHNYVLNQAQALQTQIQTRHSLSVPQFNLLYSLPSAVSLVFIIPLGILYDKHSLLILITGAVMLLVGQILVTIFGPNIGQYSYQALIGGRILQGTGAEVLYMIQGNLASTWMGRLAGLIFILPECGEIANVFITPWINEDYGISNALLIGLVTCVISFIACLYLHKHLKFTKGHLSVELTQQSNESVAQVHESSQGHEDIHESIQNSPSKKVEQMQEDIKIVDDKQKQKIENLKQVPVSILSAGKVFWLMVCLCAFNECLFFPFLDNANVFVEKCFSVNYKKTGAYLCLPFIFAICITAILGQFVLHRFKRKNLIFFSTLVPLIGHFMIFMSTNCQQQTSLSQKTFLAMGLSFFGMGLGSYYSISFPAVGLCVPEKIRGSAYACLCFFQTLSMTLVPIISGNIIGGDDKQGFRSSSLFFVFLSFSAAIVGYIIMKNVENDSFDYNDEENDHEKELLMINQ